MTSQARPSQRIFSFVIDYMIIVAIGLGLTYLVNYIIFKASGYNIMDKADYCYSLLIQQYNSFYNNMNEVTQAEVDHLVELLNDYIKAYSLELLLKGGMYLIAICGYILPLSFKWKWQTVGRRAMMCKVIRVDGSEMTTKNILLRELLGMYLLFCFFGLRVFIIISLILIACGKRSLLDAISGTKCVTLKPDEIIESHQYHEDVMHKFNGEDDYVDAKFKDDNDYINFKHKEDKNEADDSYGNYYGEDFLNKENKKDDSEDNSDDEYKII